MEKFSTFRKALKVAAVVAPLLFLNGDKSESSNHSIFDTYNSKNPNKEVKILLDHIPEYNSKNSNFFLETEGGDKNPEPQISLIKKGDSIFELNFTIDGVQHKIDIPVNAKTVNIYKGKLSMIRMDVNNYYNRGEAIRPIADGSGDYEVYCSLSLSSLIDTESEAVEKLDSLINTEEDRYNAHRKAFSAKHSNLVDKEVTYEMGILVDAAAKAFITQDENPLEKIQDSINVEVKRELGPKEIIARKLYKPIRFKIRIPKDIYDQLIEGGLYGEEELYGKNFILPEKWTKLLQPLIVNFLFKTDFPVSK